MSEPDTCIICGEIIPEGIQICPLCEKNIVKIRPMDYYKNTDPVYKGDVFFADLNPVAGSEIGGIRPVVVIQNNTGNKYSPTVVTAITSRTNRKNLPTHVSVKAPTGGLFADSVIMLEQIRTLDKSRLRQFIGRVDDETMHRIETAAKTSLGIRS